MTQAEREAAAATMIKKDDPVGECDAACLAAQEARKKARQEVLAKKANFEAGVVRYEKANSEAEFVTAVEGLLQEIQVQGRVPEGYKIPDLVKRLRIAYNGLPQTRIPCGKDVRPDVKCFTAGKTASRLKRTVHARSRSLVLLFLLERMLTFARTCHLAGKGAEAAYEQLVIAVKNGSLLDYGGGLSKVMITQF